VIPLPIAKRYNSLHPVAGPEAFISLGWYREIKLSSLCGRGLFFVFRACFWVLLLKPVFKACSIKVGRKVMGVSGEATWRICILPDIPYTNQKNTSSQEPEPHPLPSSLTLLNNLFVNILLQHHNKGASKQWITVKP
jgi:hypothetical protein